MKKELKTEFFNLRLTPSQKRKIYAEAEKYNMPPRTYAEDKLVNGKMRVSYAKRKICTTLVTVGNYLDEISSILDTEQSDYILKEQLFKPLENARKEISTIWKY